jgi:hypothetical protein
MPYEHLMLLIKAIHPALSGVNAERKSSEIPQTLAISWFVAARCPGWRIGAIGFTRSYRWAIGNQPSLLPIAC